MPYTAMHDEPDDRRSGSKRYLFLLALNYFFLFAGSVSSSLLSKFYFIHKGSSRWASTFVQSAGFPLLLPAVYILHYASGPDPASRKKPFSRFTPGVFLISVIIGILLGINNLLYSWGNSYLPISTNSLLLSTQLLFTLVASVLIVKEKVTFSDLNCVILLTLSSILIGLNSGHDRPDGVTRDKYFVGFVSTIGAGLLFALYLPVMQKVYSGVHYYAMVVEMQLVMEIASTAFAVAGMAVSGGFAEMKADMDHKFDLGPRAYVLTVGVNLVTWQLAFMGTAGMVYLTTSLTGGICMTALMAMNVVGGVLVYGDRFDGSKAVSTALCLWGFSSYLHGMYKKKKSRDNGGGSGESA
ncbi:unnamed protein product [Cuscuta europaea]|uniref:Probable purine permease n=1 Tax=Cuscuta europaea TaxID=41803 RepID=A0A9P0YMS2_CUSEU|nr:unnamed protein product [Cuscuta europaea]